MSPGISLINKILDRRPLRKLSIQISTLAIRLLNRFFYVGYRTDWLKLKS
jgi:hypothetical protein